MKAKRPETNYEPVPAGNHVARLYQIIHIGTNSFEYMGETKKSDKIRLTFELCNEKKAFKEGEEPRPFSISREFGFSMGKKSHLRPFIEGLIGTGLMDDEAYAFELEDILGDACLLNVVHVTKGDNTYANIASASPLPKGMEAPALFNEKKVIDVDNSPFEEIEALPDFIKEKMKSSEEYRSRVNYNEKMDEAGLSPKAFRPKSVEREIEVNEEDVPF